MKNCRAGQRDRAEVEPAARCECADESGEGKKSGREAGNEVAGAARIDEVVVEDAAALNGGDNGRCAEHGDEGSQFAEECCEGREALLVVEMAGAAEDGASDEGEADHQQGEDEDGPARAQTLRAKKDAHNEARRWRCIGSGKGLCLG